MNEDAAIVFDRVSKSFEGTPVLKDLSWSLRRGEIMSVVGPSGTGKSVMLKHIVGLLYPDSGQVTVASEKIGYLFQSGALLAWKTLWENVALPLEENTDLDDATIDAKVMAALKAVGLEADAEKYPSEISGGMQKRAGLARAIVRDAEIILYDEPTSGLDPITSAQITKLIVELNHRLKVTSIVVTHDLESAIRVSDRILLLSGGSAQFCGAPAEFVASALPQVQEFLKAAKGEE